MRNVPYSRAYSYIVTVPPEKMAVSLELFKAHLKKRSSDTKEDTLLSLYLRAAIEYAEAFTRRDLIARTYRTFRDFFPGPYTHEGYYREGYIPNSHDITGVDSNVGFEIQRSPLRTVEQIQYYSGGSLTVLDPSFYYNTIEMDYSEILAINEWPTDIDNRLQSIQIDFTCGMAENESQVPAGYIEAIMAHATAIRQNRGDCSANGCAKFLPATSKSFYLQNRIENL